MTMNHVSGVLSAGIVYRLFISALVGLGIPSRETSSTSFVLHVGIFQFRFHHLYCPVLLWKYCSKKDKPPVKMLNVIAWSSFGIELPILLSVQK